jgi:hypothetical protein
VKKKGGAQKIRDAPRRPETCPGRDGPGIRGCWGPRRHRGERNHKKKTGSNNEVRAKRNMWTDSECVGAADSSGKQTTCAEGLLEPPETIKPKKRVIAMVGMNRMEVNPSLVQKTKAPNGAWERERSTTEGWG